MISHIEKWFYNSTFYRYIFWGLFLLSVLLSFVFPHEDDIFIFYIFAALFFGIGYYNKPVFLIFLTGLLADCRVYIASISEESFFLIYLTYLLIALISSGLMVYIQKVKKDSLDLTKSLINALDSRDTYTSDHSNNTSNYAVKIAEKMYLSNDLCNVIRTGALLHDIGKIGIAEHILTKPGMLTEDEYKLIKTHPTIGYEMLKHIESFKKNGVFDIVLYHHERYDGKGYPVGLNGSEIPLAARIVAVADAFDAMTTHRVYRNGLELNYALNEIRKNSGKQFDPDVVIAFLSLFDEMDIKEDRTA